MIITKKKLFKYLLASKDFENLVADLVIQEINRDKVFVIKKIDPSEYEEMFISFADKKEAKFKPIVAKFFNDQKEAVLKSLQKKSFTPIIKANKYEGWAFPNREDWIERLAKEEEDFIREIYEQFGKKIWDELKFVVVPDALQGSFNTTSKGLQKYFQDYSFKFSNDIQNVTEGEIENIIQGIIEDGVKQGWSNDIIAANIEDKVGRKYDDWEDYRSDRIARTETIRATNGAAKEAYLQSGVVEGIYWLATKDDLTCPICMELNGKFIKLNGKSAFFEADEYGDGTTPPRHVNCRCTIVAKVNSKYDLDNYTGEKPKPVKGLSSIFKGGVGSGIRGHVTVKPDHLAHIRIPPAWANVKYNPDPKAAVQVIGIDSKGRQQVIYNEKFKDKQAKAKYKRVKELSNKFDSIKKQNEENFKNEDKKVREHAQIIKLIMHTGIRPGSETDTKAKVKAYGATTLEGRHVVKDSSGNVSLKFIGKKGKELDIPIHNKDVANILIKRADKSGPSGQLFKMTNDASLRGYVDKLDGGGFKTKDFRTRLANKIAENEMAKVKKPKSEKEYKKAVRQVAKAVSDRLGNTPTIALQSYINPAVFGKWRI
jgi:DNA topoisomerase-1